MYATGDERCPVKHFRLYTSKRPPSLRCSGPLYLSVIEKPANDDVWFKIAPMGINYLGSIVSDIIADSSIATDKKYSNHTVRKTTFKKMRSEGLSREQIRVVTGHKNIESMDAYDSGEDEALETPSNALTKKAPARPSSTIATTRLPTSEIKFTMEVPLSPVDETVPEKIVPPAQPQQPQHQIIHGDVINKHINNSSYINLPTFSSSQNSQ